MSLPEACSSLVSEVSVDVEDVPGVKFLVKQMAEDIVVDKVEGAFHVVAGEDGRTQGTDHVPWWSQELSVTTQCPQASGQKGYQALKDEEYIIV